MLNNNIKTISLVIPVFNESKIIKESVDLIKRQMDPLDYKWELIIVDDGSTDNTVNIILQMVEEIPNIRVITQNRNYGPGAAFRIGFKEAKGDVIITNDADSSFSPDYIPKMIDGLKNADVVIGSQHLKKSKIVNVPFIRVLASKTASFLDRLILGVKLSTLTSFFVAYKKKVVENITFKANGFDAQCEILTTIFKKGYKIKEIPCTLQWSLGRSNRISMMGLFYDFRKRVILWKRLRKQFKNL